MSATVDYLTMTSKSDKVGFDWYEKFCYLRDNSLEMKGRQVSNRDLLGYSGFAIDGALWWGHNHVNGYIMQAVSKFADDLYGKLYAPLGNVTRIDLAVTMKLDPPDKNMAARHYNKLLKTGLKTANNRILTSSKGGTTLYVGSAKSDRFGRLYDKGLQSGTEEGGKLWRYEVVIRKPRASQVAAEIAKTMRQESFTDHTRNMIGSYVYKWFLDRGVKPFWSPEKVVEMPVHIDYEETSADRKLRWIREQVSPSMAWLWKEGFRDELEEAIGFQLSLPTET